MYARPGEVIPAVDSSSFCNRSEKQLFDRHFEDLLTKDKTAVIKGFKSKSGNTFDVALEFDADPLKSAYT
jgi:hypothetical protein